MDASVCLFLISLCFSQIIAQPVIPQAPKVIQCVDGEAAILLKHDKLSPQIAPNKIAKATLKECSDFCSNNQINGESFPCVGFKFTPDDDICDMYSDFAVLVPSPVDFFQKTCVGDIQPSAPSQPEQEIIEEEVAENTVNGGLNPTIATVSECGEGESAIMIMHGQSGPSQTSTHVFAELSLDECSEICRQNMDTITKETISCAGFDYDLPTRTCKTFESFDSAGLQFGAADFYQKSCVKCKKN